MSPAENDPLGYLDELREALRSPFMQLLFLPTATVRTTVLKSLSVELGATVSSSSLSAFGDQAELDDVRWELAAVAADRASELRENAVTVASSLGFCRLYGINLPLDIRHIIERPLPPELIVPAVMASLRMLKVATDDARALPEHFDASEPLEDRSYCTSLLHLLMELWAIFIVVDDEYQQHICAGQSVGSTFGVWMHRLLDAFAALDEELQRDEQLCLLSIATELPLLDNWRKMLSKPYRDPLPWWLNGTLETFAEETQKRINRESSLRHASGKQHRPRAMVMLADRNNEIASQAAQFAIAASAGEVGGAAADSLRCATWPIVGELAVHVRLELRPRKDGQRELAIALIGVTADKRKCLLAEVGFRSGITRQTALQLGFGIVQLLEHEVAEVASLVLVDETGDRRTVNLE